MLSDDPPVLADCDAIRIGMNLDRMPDRTGHHRVLVVIEAHQAGLRDRRLHRVEAIELASIGNELRPLRLEHFPDCLLSQLWMVMHLGVGDAFIEQPGVQFVKILEPQTRREEAFADEPNLVLELPLLPARCRCAGDRIDEVVAAHLQEVAIVDALQLRVYLWIALDRSTLRASTRALERAEG